MTAKIYQSTASGRVDVTQLATEYSWSGDYQSAVRELSLKLALPAGAVNWPKASVELGDAFALDVDGVTKFAGMAVSIGRLSDSGVVDVRCYDGGRILKGNSATYQFVNTTPEAVAGRIAQDTGLELGELAATGIPITRNFVAVDLFSIIMTMYSLAGEQNGKKYVASFDGLKFRVLEKGKPAEPVRLQAKSNIMDLAVSESVEKLVNRVAIYNDSNAVINTLEDAGSVSRYGAMQDMVKESDTAEQKARQTLEDRGPAQKITVNNLGDIRCITGTVVEVMEPRTGLVGDFYIDSDVHTWKNGQYYNKLVLNFKNLMADKTAGNEK